MIEKLRDEYKITNKALLIQCGTISGIVFFLFIIHGILLMVPGGSAIPSLFMAYLKAAFISMIIAIILSSGWLPTQF